MLSALTQLFRRKSPAPPEHAWRVWATEDALYCVYRGGSTAIAWNSIDQIRIVTNDEGPLLPDVFWHFRSADKEVAFPQLAQGEKEVVDRAMGFTGFDYDAFGRAMASTSNAEFIVWRR